MIVLDDAGRVLVFDRDGKVLRRWSMPDVSVGRPEGVVVLNDGRIVVGDTHYTTDGSSFVTHTTARSRRLIG
ncbi:MAG: sugar lactone lactonase YvrE [Verrucomicrobiales bacterium]